MKNTFFSTSTFPAIRTAALALLLCAARGWATDYTFNGSSSTDWNTGVNWTPNGVPGADPADTATIPAGQTVVVAESHSLTSVAFDNSSASAASLTVNNGATLALSGDLTLQTSATVNTAATIAGAGAISCADVNVGSPVTVGTVSVTETLTSTLATLTLSGNFTVLSSYVSTTKRCNADFELQSGTVTVGGALAFSGGANAGSICTLNLNGGAATGTLILGGAITTTATTKITVTWTSGTVKYAGSGQTVYATGYNNLEFSGAGTTTGPSATETVGGTLTIDTNATLAIPATRVLNVTGATTINGALTFAASASPIYTGNVTINGSYTTGGGTHTFNGNFTLAAGGVWLENASTTVTCAGSFGVSGSFTTHGGTHTLNGTATIAATTGSYTEGASSTLTVGAGVAFNVNGSFTTDGGTHTFNGDVTLANGSTWLENASTTVVCAGSFINNGATFTASAGGHSFTGASGTNTIGGNLHALSIPSVTVNGTYTLNGTLTVGTTLAGSGTLTLAANSALNIGGTSTGVTLNCAANPPNTVTYTKAGTQTILAGTYYNLTTGGSGAKTLGGSAAVNGNLTIGVGTTLTASAFTLSVAGNVVNNGALSVASATVTFNGTTNQSVTGSFIAFGNLTVNNTGAEGANTVTVYSGDSVSGATTITAGHLVTVGPVVELIWSTPPPASVPPNTIITPYPVLQTADINGNPSTVGLGASQPIILSLSGAGTLSGTTIFDIGTASTNGSTGTVICSNLSVSGGGDLTLSAAPGNGLNPATIPGICLWLDGSDSNSMTFNGDTITAWNDKSGAGLNFDTTFSDNPPGPIALTAGADILNGRTGVSFPGDGIGDGSSLACTYLNINNDNLSIYVMTKQTVALNGYFRLWAFGNATDADFDTDGLYFFRNGNYATARGNVQLGGGVTPPALGIPWLGEVTFNGSTATTALLQKGAAAQSGSAASSGNFNLTASTVAGALNAGYTDGGAYWSGPVYEYIIYTNALSGPDQAAVETYLTNKWFPVITTPATASFTSEGNGATNNQSQIISGVTNNGDGTVTFTLGGQPGYTYHLQTAANLNPPISWVDLNGSSTSAPAGGTWSYTDAGASNFPARFYRSVSP